MIEVRNRDVALLFRQVAILFKEDPTKTYQRESKKYVGESIYLSILKKYRLKLELIEFPIFCIVFNKNLQWEWNSGSVSITVFPGICSIPSRDGNSNFPYGSKSHRKKYLCKNQDMLK